MKKYILLSTLLALSVNMAHARQSFSAKIDCIDLVGTPMQVKYSSRGEATIQSEDGIVTENNASMKIKSIFNGYEQKTSFKLEIDENNSFNLLVDDFTYLSGKFKGRANFSIGTLSGNDIQCEMDYKTSDLVNDEVLRSSLTGGLLLKNTLAARNEYSLLNDYELQQHLATLPNRPGYSCAKGVREILNILFGFGPKNGKNARDYNEKVLSQWETRELKYVRVASDVYGNTFGPSYNYDIRVLQPAASCPSEMVRKYGHIEFFYNGVWYSDFRQGGSAYDGDLWYAQNNPYHRRCYSSKAVYRIYRK